jgi:hypothetical protein
MGIYVSEDATAPTFRTNIAEHRDTNIHHRQNRYVSENVAAPIFRTNIPEHRVKHSPPPEPQISYATITGLQNKPDTNAVRMMSGSASPVLRTRNLGPTTLIWACKQ